jgi:hypothetical protein
MSRNWRAASGSAKFSQAARAGARKAQIARMRRLSGRADYGDAALSALLLKAERLCDAAADGELADMGLSSAAAYGLVAAAMTRVIGWET